LLQWHLNFWWRKKLQEEWQLLYISYLLYTHRSSN
jgi:hypothetical protein